MLGEPLGNRNKLKDRDQGSQEPENSQAREARTLPVGTNRCQHQGQHQRQRQQRGERIEEPPRLSDRRVGVIDALGQGKQKKLEIADRVAAGIVDHREPPRLAPGGDKTRRRQGNDGEGEGYRPEDGMESQAAGTENRTTRQINQREHSRQCDHHLLGKKSQREERGSQQQDTQVRLLFTRNRQVQRQAGQEEEGREHVPSR